MTQLKSASSGFKVALIHTENEDKDRFHAEARRRGENMIMKEMKIIQRHS